MGLHLLCRAEVTLIVSTIRLPKHELSEDINRNANTQRIKAQEALTLHNSATVECQQWERLPSLGKSTQLIIQCQVINPEVILYIIYI